MLVHGAELWLSRSGHSMFQTARTSHVSSLTSRLVHGTAEAWIGLGLCPRSHNKGQPLLLRTREGLFPPGSPANTVPSLLRSVPRRTYGRGRAEPFTLRSKKHSLTPCSQRGVASPPRDGPQPSVPVGSPFSSAHPPLQRNRLHRPEGVTLPLQPSLPLLLPPGNCLVPLSA